MLGEPSPGPRPRLDARKPEAAEDPVRAVRRALTSPDEATRRQAAYAVRNGQVHGAETVRALMAALGDESVAVRMAVADALGRIGPASRLAAGALARRLDRDGSADVRTAVARSLGAIGPSARGAAGALLDALRDEDALVRKAAAQAFAAVDPGEFTDLLVHLASSELRLQIAATQAIGWMGDRGSRAVAHLLRLFDETDSEALQVAILEALDRIGPAAESALPQVMRALESNHGLGRRAAFGALAGIAPSGNGTLRVLRTALIDPDPRVAIDGLRALKRLGIAATPSVPDMVRALDHPDLREDAARAIAAVGPGAGLAVPALIRVLASSDGAVHRAVWCALSAVGDHAVPALRWATRSSSAPVRRGVAAALGVLGDPTARADLACLAVDDDPDVRRAAESALRVLEARPSLANANSD